jgi:hypothetical protein
VVATKRQSRDNGDWRITRDDAAGRKLITDDAVIDLGIEEAFVESNACAAV